MVESNDRARARWAGIWYLVTFATSLPALALKKPFLDGDPDASGAAAQFGCVLEVILAVSCVGTAIALYPIIRRHSDARARGFVASRTVEATLVVMGVVAVVALVTVRDAPGTSSGVDDALVALHDGAFLLGPGLLPAVNALLLAPVLYANRLVPRAIPALGIIGAPLLLASATATILGLVSQVSPIGALAAAPIALWELALGVWLTARGVREHSEASNSTPVAVA